MSDIITIKAKPFIIINNNKKYAIVTSLHHPELIVDQKYIKLKLLVNYIDETHKLFGVRYYILCGGTQIYTSIFDSTKLENILPVNNVPFGFLKYHKLEFIFLFNFVDTMLLEFKIEKAYNIECKKIKVRKYEMDVIDWKYDDLRGAEKNLLLRFSCGMCGVSHIDYNDSGYNHDTIKIPCLAKLPDTTICLIDQKNYDNEKIFYGASNEPLSYMKNNKDTSNLIVYDKQYYNFVVKEHNYIDDNFMNFLSSDCICNFELIYKCDENIIKKANYDLKPNIYFNGVILDCLEYTYDLVNNRIIFYFDVYKSKMRCAWINLMTDRFYNDKLCINGLLEGTYTLTYERVYCQGYLRKKIAMSGDRIINCVFKECADVNDCIEGWKDENYNNLLNNFDG